jgi:hypothetical protein
VLDISGLATVEGSPTAVGIGRGVGMREVGHYVFPDSDTWSFKTNRISRDGSFFGYGNDLVRGFDVYRFTGLPRRKVQPLVPRDLAPRATSGTDASAALGPLAVLLPALVGAGLIRRHTRRA